MVSREVVNKMCSGVFCGVILSPKEQKTNSKEITAFCHFSELNWFAVRCYNCWWCCEKRDRTMQVRVGRCEEGRMVEKANKHQERRMGRIRPSTFSRKPLGRLNCQWNYILGSKCSHFECMSARIAAWLSMCTCNGTLKVFHL